MLYFSFIYPHLLSGVEVYANTSKSSLKRLMVLNNKLLRVLQMHPRDVRILYSYIKSIIHYLFQNCKIIRYYCWCTNYCIRAKNCLQLLTAILFQILQFIAIVLEVAVTYICCPQLLFVKKLIKFKTSQLWNKLPDQLKQIRSLNSFKLQLKIIYLIKYAEKNK